MTTETETRDVTEDTESPEQAPSGVPLVRWLEVTPALAMRWLTHAAYERQRPVRERHVALLADAIANGEFESGRISFVRVGKQRFLVDGQHRLAAIARAGVGVSMEVGERTVATMEDVHRIYARTDRGLGRATPDVLKARGLFDDSALSRTMVLKASSACGLIITGFEPLGKANTATASTDIRAAVLADWLPAAEAYAAFIAGATDALKRRLVSSPIMAVGMVTSRYAEDRAAEFWGRLAADDGLRAGEPEHTLARYLVGNPVGARGATGYARVAAAAWNAAYAGREWGKVVVKDEALGRPILIAGTPYDGKRVLAFHRPTPPVPNGLA